MEVIHEVEATGRETYTGAIGYASPAAGLELSVAIRTFEFSAGRVWFGAGGGVVIDSTPEGERVETLVKAKPLVQAIGARLSPWRRASTSTRGSERSRSGDARRSADRRLERAVDLSRASSRRCWWSDGRPVDLDAHLARLGASVARLLRGACFPRPRRPGRRAGSRSLGAASSPHHGPPCP